MDRQDLKPGDLVIGNASAQYGITYQGTVWEVKKIFRDEITIRKFDTNGDEHSFSVRKSAFDRLPVQPGDIVLYKGRKTLINGVSFYDSDGQNNSTLTITINNISYETEVKALLQDLAPFDPTTEFTDLDDDRELL